MHIGLWCAQSPLQDALIGDVEENGRSEWATESESCGETEASHAKVL